MLARARRREITIACPMTIDLQPLLRTGRPQSLRELVLPAPLNVLVLAPHPDDFDAIAVTLRHLHLQGHAVHVAVLTSGASGVDDGFEGAFDDAAKATLREKEQRESRAMFGLPPERLEFLRLWEAGDDAADDAKLRDWIAAHAGDLLFMPHGNDSNRTHRRTHDTVRAAAAELGLDTWACLNQDAKTLGMRLDLFFDFDEEGATWKAGLLRCHRSQQERNLRTRGMGFDQRVLEVNRQAAAGLPTALPYAEAFEVARLGAA
jgi:LmbE family N-acetylglucosaminyl deacetylase